MSEEVAENEYQTPSVYAAEQEKDSVAPPEQVVPFWQAAPALKVIAEAQLVFVAGVQPPPAMD